MLREHRWQQLGQRAARGLGTLPDDAPVAAAIDGKPRSLNAASKAQGHAAMTPVPAPPACTAYGTRTLAAHRPGGDIVTVSKRPGTEAINTALAGLRQK